MPTEARFTRRALLAATGAMVAARAQTELVIPPEFKRYADAATESPVTRLTDPAHASLLPAWQSTATTRHGRTLLYSNDRTGRMQAYRMDLKTGESHQLTDGEAVRPSALTLLPDEKSFACLAGRSLLVQQLKPVRPREAYRVPADFEPTDAFSVSRDGAFAVLVEQRATSWRLRRVPLARPGSVTTIAESPVELRDAMLRPGAEAVLYRVGASELHLSPSGRLLTSATGPAIWSPDGGSVLYLNVPADIRQPNTIRVFDLTAGKDSLVSNTSRFASFGRNANATVFVGASASKASPAVLLLLRSVRRELTLCEHRASDAALVTPRFTSDSQHILFQSDRSGKMAIYMVNVERFVEETDDE